MSWSRRDVARRDVALVTARQYASYVQEDVRS